MDKFPLHRIKTVFNINDKSNKDGELTSPGQQFRIATEMDPEIFILSKISSAQDLLAICQLQVIKPSQLLFCEENPSPTMTLLSKENVLLVMKLAWIYFQIEPNLLLLLLCTTSIPSTC